MCKTKTFVGKKAHWNKRLKIEFVLLLIVCTFSGFRFSAEQPLSLRLSPSDSHRWMSLGLPTVETTAIKTSGFWIRAKETFQIAKIVIDFPYSSVTCTCTTFSNVLSLLWTLWCYLVWFRKQKRQKTLTKVDNILSDIQDRPSPKIFIESYLNTVIRVVRTLTTILQTFTVGITQNLPAIHKIWKRFLNLTFITDNRWSPEEMKKIIARRKLHN